MEEKIDALEFLINSFMIQDCLNIWESLEKKTDQELEKCIKDAEIFLNCKSLLHFDNYEEKIRFVLHLGIEMKHWFLFYKYATSILENRKKYQEKNNVRKERKQD